MTFSGNLIDLEGSYLDLLVEILLRYEPCMSPIVHF